MTNKLYVLPNKNDRIKLEDLIDIEELRQLFERFSKISGYPVGLISYPEQELYFTVGWRDVCSKYHRFNPESNKFCVQSNRNLTEGLEKQTQINISYCLNGMVDGATPIIVDGQHIASLFTGQVFFDKPSKTEFLARSKTFEYNTNEYLKAVEAVPIVKERELKDVLLFLVDLAESKAKSALLRLREKQLIEKTELHKDIEESKIALLDVIPDIVFGMDKKGTFLFYVPSKNIKLLLPSDEFIGKNVLDIMPPDIARLTIRVLDQLFSTKKKQEIEYSLNNKGKQEYFKARFVLKGEGEALVVVEDISQSVEIRKKLKVNLFRQKALLSAIPEIVMEVDNDKRYTYANKAGFDFFGADVIGKTAETYFVGEQETYDKVQPIFDGSDELVYVESLQRRKDGAFRLLAWRVQVMKDDKSNIIGSISTARDITEENQAQRELIQNKEFLESITESTSSGIVICQDSKIVYVNASLLKYLELNKSSLIGANLLKYTLPQDKALFQQANKNVLFGENNESNIEFRILSSSQKEVWLSYSAKRIKWNNKTAIIGSLINISKRKITEIKLQEKEKIFRNIFIQHSATILIINPENGLIIEANQAASDFYGWSISELETMNISQINTLGSQTIRKTMQAVIDKKADYFEFVHRKKDGTLVDVEVFSNSVVVNNNKFLHSIIIDISDKKKALKQAIKLSRAVEQSTSVIVMTDKDGIIEYVNPVFETITGYTLKEVIGKTPRILKSGSYSDAYYKEMWDTILLGKTWSGEIENKRKDGTLYWEHLVISPIISAKQEVTHFVAVKDDITEAKQLRSKIEKSERYFRKLIEKSTDIYSILDSKGVLLYEGTTASSILGYDLQELNNRSVFDYIHPDDVDDIQVLFDNLINGITKVTDLNFRFKHKNGQWLNIEGVARNLLDDPDINGILVNYRDVTKKIKLMEDLVFAKKRAEQSDNLKTAFLQNMSHEIRTPLNGILGFSQLMQTASIKEKEFREYSGIINNSGRRLLDLINNILDISKIEAGTVKIFEESISLNEFFVKTVDTLSLKAKAKRLDLIIDYDKTVKSPQIKVDIGKLSQIIINLVNNAIKFTRKGQITCSYKIREDNILFQIKDTGVGISENQVPKVFKRFYQVDQKISREFEGAGLGLSITRGLVSILKGEIWIESELNEGTSFFFTIPYVTTKKKSKLINSNYKSLSNRTLNILVAEDDESNYFLIETLLSKFDVIIHHVENGQDAVDYCIEYKNLDLILMDINMPVMDGLTATKKIRKLYPNLPIIAQTAYAFETEREDALSIGCSDYIAKPFSKVDLFKKISKLVNK